MKLTSTVVTPESLRPMRQGITIVLMVLLLASSTPMFGSYLASGSPAFRPGSVYPGSSMTLWPGIISPIVKVSVSSLASSEQVGVSAGSQLQGLSAISNAAAGPAVLGALSSSSSSVLSGFDGLNQIQSCACVPPDVQVAAGPNHLVEMVNLEAEIFSKQGVTNKTFTLSSFFKTGSDFISDPKVLFDPLSGRWFTSLVDVTLNSVLIGVSSTGDPTGTWTLYALSAGGNLPDQPIIGVSNDEFVASANDFFSRSFVGDQFWVLNKSEMLTGSVVSLVTSGANSGFFSIHPVQSLSSTKTQYMVGNIVSRKALVTSSAQLFSVAGVPGVSTVTANTTVLTVSNLGIPPGGVQPGTSSTINTGDFRVQDAAWFMGKLWYGLNDACTPSGDTQVRSCIRLSMIDTMTSPATVKQEFDFGASGQYLFYPALKIDGNGDLDLTYGFSSATTFPSLAVTGQAVTDPANSLTLPRTLKAGSAADTSTRYGDYFGSGLDPSTPTVVWVAGEYDSNATGACGSFGSCWSTFIGSVTVVSPIPVSVSSLVSFAGLNVNTTGSLTINTVDSTVSGSATVVARNSTTGMIIFTKTYSLPSIKLQNQMHNLQGSFLLNLAINPYPLSSDVTVTLQGGVAGTVVVVTRQIDINRDGAVDIGDIATIAISFGSALGSPNYNPAADLDANGIVNVIDLATAAIYYGALNFT